MPLRERNRSFIVLAVLLAFHLILVSVQVPRGAGKTYFEKAVFAVFAPLQKATVSALRGVKSVWADYFDLRGVRKENQDLRRELFFKEQELRHFEERIEFLRAAAQARENLPAYRDSLILAGVIGADASNYFRSIVLNRGKHDGVRTNMPVCDRFGNLVGRTVEPVTEGEASVQLITDEDSSVGVESVSDDPIIGIMRGKSDILCAMMYVLSSASGGKVNEIVRTSGKDLIYPRGLPVGVIKSNTPTLSTFRDIRIQPYFSPRALEAVAILPRVLGGER